MVKLSSYLKIRPYDDNANKLNRQDAEMFHSTVAKLLFAAKRARPDIQTAIAFLCTRVKSPDEDDQKKLIRVLGYIKNTIYLPLTIGWDGTGNMYWYVDASFGVHHDMRSHTGGVMTFGRGAAPWVFQTANSWGGHDVSAIHEGKERLNLP